MQKLISAYEQIRIGSPFDTETLCGPVHTESSVNLYKTTIQKARKQGGRIIFGDEVLNQMGGGNFVVPTICEFDSSAEIMNFESFVPILYIMKFKVKR